MLDYKTQHENRKSGTKDLAKSLLFLLSGLILSFVAYAIYMAFSRQPEAMEGILLVIGPFSLLWAFERVWWHKRKRVEAESRLFDFEQHKRDIVDSVIAQVRGMKPAQEPDSDRLLRLQGATEEELIENMRYMLPGLNYYGIKRLLDRYKEFPRVKLVLLNALKFWERDDKRDKYKSRIEIEGVSSSPTVIEFSA